MLRSTFLHLPGIGPATEFALWRDGVRDWKDLAALVQRADWGRTRRERLVLEIEGSERALSGGDAAWFGRRLPPSEHWRLYSHFQERTGFLDIETTGLSPYGGMVTVVTVHGGGDTRTFIAGEDLEELPAYLRRFPILVTFNGRNFDVPFLEACFPALVAPPVHIDLRFVFYRLGLAGGLKRIEEHLGIGDRSGVEGIRGLDAVRLWKEYRAGNPASLERLVRYNRADTVNLEPLLVRATTDLERRLLGSPTLNAARG
ncbi:MAG: ribonuclease H-like domain-containing protein [Thermoplasmata archaeon]